MSLNGRAYIVGAFEHPTRKAETASVAQLNEPAGLSTSATGCQRAPVARMAQRGTSESLLTTRTDTLHMARARCSVSP